MIKKFDCLVCKLELDSHTKLKNHYANFHPGFQPEWSAAVDNPLRVVEQANNSLGFFRPEDFLVFEGNKMTVGNVTFVFGEKELGLARGFSVLAAFTANVILSKHMTSLPIIDATQEPWKVVSGEIFPGTSVAKVIKK